MKAEDIPENPFTPVDLENMNANIELGKKIQKHIDLAKRAGINVSKQEEDLNKAMEQIQKIKSVYFPGA